MNTDISYCMLFSGVLRMYDENFLNEKVIDTTRCQMFASVNKNWDSVSPVTQVVDKYEVPLDWTFVDRNEGWLNYNACSMFYHNQNVYQQYIDKLDINPDVIIKFRNDERSDQHFPLPTTKLPDNTVFVPIIEHYFGMNDQIAYGNKQSMDVYFKVYDSIYKYCHDEGVWFHPETLLGYHLRKNGIQLELFDYNYWICR